MPTTSSGSTPPSGATSADLAFCVAESNRYRTLTSRPALAQSAALEAYAGRARKSTTPRGWHIRTSIARMAVVSPSPKTNSWRRRSASSITLSRRPCAKRLGAFTLKARAWPLSKSRRAVHASGLRCVHRWRANYVRAGFPVGEGGRHPGQHAKRPRFGAGLANKRLVWRVRRGGYPTVARHVHALMSNQAKPAPSSRMVLGSGTSLRRTLAFVVTSDVKLSAKTSTVLPGYANATTW
jgi:hypothetical protein